MLLIQIGNFAKSRKETLTVKLAACGYQVYAFALFFKSNFKSNKNTNNLYLANIIYKKNDSHNIFLTSNTHTHI